MTQKEKGGLFVTDTKQRPILGSFDAWKRMMEQGNLRTKFPDCPVCLNGDTFEKVSCEDLNDDTGIMFKCNSCYSIFRACFNESDYTRIY